MNIWKILLTIKHLFEENTKVLDMQYSLTNDKGYRTWLADIKLKVHNAQLKAAVKVNTELLRLYWELGSDIVAKQKYAKWGDGFLAQLSKDLTEEFPDIKSLSGILSLFGNGIHFMPKSSNRILHNLRNSLFRKFHGGIISL